MIMKVNDDDKEIKTIIQINKEKNIKNHDLKLYLTNSQFDNFRKK